ncbi:MAG TPA: metal-dependent transcriptional regulator [Bacteroidia bacterium]|jgi:DtxR family Mn-dependent transcriptional regulator|nr:metal-dependent transcriptional regulator [Bacteroidia bacterium]
MHSFSEENYLKAIYHLGADGAKISLTAIAEALHNNPASVIDMVKKLTEKKLISYDKKKGAKLTNSGIKAAMEIIRKHRLWEVFLLEKLGYKWDEVHNIAEQLEHVGDSGLAERLEKFLGFPDYDPHGDPIPKADGKIAEVFKTMLIEVEAGKQYKVVAVKDTSAEFLHYLQKLGIGIGTRIKVIEKIAFDGSLVIQIEKNTNTTISNKFAENVLVS